MARQAALAEELASLHNTDDRLLALLGEHGELDPALLDKEYRFRLFALAEDRLVFPVLGDRLAATDMGEKALRIELVLGHLVQHRSTLQYPPTLAVS